MNRIADIPGWLDGPEGKVLEHYAKDEVVLEIGCFMGRSTVAMAPAAKRLICIDYFLIGLEERHYDDKRRIIPPEEKPDTRAVFEKNVAPWRDKIEVYEMNTLEAVKLDWEPIGLLFIDGGHDYETVRSDCGFAKWVRIGGHVIFHDINRKPVARVIKEMMTDNPEWKNIPQELPHAAVFERVQ